MSKKYYSLDLEASGRTSPKYSVLSIGVAIVGETEKHQFYRELKPISKRYDVDAMRVACRQLECLIPYRGNELLNPESDVFRPELVLMMLKKTGVPPKKAINELASWIEQTRDGKTPLLVAGPAVFDGGHISHYFDNFYSGQNPFTYKCKDIGSMCNGLFRSMEKSAEFLNVPDTRKRPHHALDDAIQQAKEFERVLELMNDNKLLERFMT